MKLPQWNQMGEADAAQAIQPCNAAIAWAQGVAAERPFASIEDLIAASDRIWDGLSSKDWKQAFDAHPRIGEAKAHAASAESLAMSAGEQAQAVADVGARAALAEANAAYESRFGRIFIVCATGKSASEMLTIVRQRMANDAATELLEAAQQQKLITRLRLHKLLGVA